MSEVKTAVGVGKYDWRRLSHVFAQYIFAQYDSAQMASTRPCPMPQAQSLLACQCERAKRTTCVVGICLWTVINIRKLVESSDHCLWLGRPLQCIALMHYPCRHLQTDRRTDGRTPDHYTTFSTRRCQHNNRLRTHKAEEADRHAQWRTIIIRKIINSIVQAFCHNTKVNLLLSAIC